MTADFILTAAEVRHAEQAAVHAGVSEAELMNIAGTGVAAAIRAFAGAMPALVLCGPGNNGGDGYVIARLLRAAGMEVRVAAAGEPSKEPAASARAAWSGRVERLDDATPAPLLIDALFGTGLRRPIDAAISSRLCALAAQARVSVAVDLPSGVDSDSGAILSPVPSYDLTVATGCLKPAHLLQPAARGMGRLVVAEIGVECQSALRRIQRPRLVAPGPDDHKYRRGYVSVQAGAMSGAAALVAAAAARSGAGYVAVAGAEVAGTPHCVVQNVSPDDPRIGARVIGPGLGRNEAARALVETALRSGVQLVLDADALHLLNAGPMLHDPILTPHAGEFTRLFDDLPGSKVEQARAAAALSQATIIFKGADTVVAAPDGRAALIAPPAWLASAGTGDVLAGVVGTMRARTLPAFEAACAGVWLHARAAELAGPHLIADDLLAQLPVAVAECL